MKQLRVATGLIAIASLMVFVSSPKVYIPKPDGRKRPLGIPCVRDREVQQALLLMMEPIFEADFTEASWGFRPGRSAQQAAGEVVKYLNWGLNRVCDVDIKAYFDSIPHERLMRMVARRIVDRYYALAVGLGKLLRGSTRPFAGRKEPLFQEIRLSLFGP